MLGIDKCYANDNDSKFTPLTKEKLSGFPYHIDNFNRYKEDNSKST